MAYYEEINGIKILRFRLLDPYTNEVLHFSTTRRFSNGNEFSMGSPGDENNRLSQQCREQLAMALSVRSSQFVFCRQTHSDHVQEVNELKTDNGFYSKHNAVQDCDALLTNKKDICLMALTADCVPVLLYDTKQNVIASVHSGWRGTARKILAVTIAKMRERFNSNPANLICCIGPSAGPCCYEVGGDVKKAFSMTLTDCSPFFAAEKNGKYLLDLHEANRQIALSCGIPDAKIEKSGICTLCNDDLYHSARRHGKNAGRMATGIMLR